MHERDASDNKPVGEVVFQDTSSDGSLTIAVWREPEEKTDLMRELGGMGFLRVYDSHTGELYHHERLALSPSAIFGPGPTADEAEHWSNIISIFSD